ncbi:ABC transporter substrate-binding protein [Hymenobacter busanensis]|uniref:ABC transporter substrate-binding protein n=1 Tax=Hymenobacter busanensis TaxID=2607656 RepID=A0A7L4ZUE4_9BACT|nr:ABC transporter substrate-binding protein [Hymenobacter busanensis]KAA9339441.1 ABC transporter substrate-binding protein [Hymenobacter busanensis]QHJ06801.1 ABC transporter substrate-binding protein [Hymenobacter busanensis]
MPAAPAKTPPAAAKPAKPGATPAAPAPKTGATPVKATATAAKPAVAKPAPTVVPAPKPAAKSAPPLPANLGSQDPDTRYRNGKTLIDQARYDLAMQELQPLTGPAAKYSRAPEAAYLYAVATSRAKKWAEAEQMLNLLRTEYPQWPSLAEAMFLQAQASFEQGDTDNALRVLEQMPLTQLRAQKAAMKATYFARLRDKALWQNLLRRHPQDTALARGYAEQLVFGGLYTEADKAQLDQVVTQFGLDRTRYTPRPRPAKKSSYNVAVLLPFEFDDPSWETRRRLQFVNDLYAGLKLAQDSLQREGRPLNLYAYDTGADTLQLKQLLQQPELASMDLIVGPVYKSGSKILARFAREKQIITVNPLSQDGDLVLDNLWHYLYEPSTATQGRQAAEFAYRAFGGGPAVVIHEDSKDETAFGQAYKTAYEALGGKVLALRRVDSEVPDAIASAFGGYDVKSAGHVVVASDSKKAGPATLNALSAQGLRVPLLTFASWLENSSVSLGQLDQREVFFIHPKYLDATLPGVRRFRQLYTQQQNIPPSVFAFTGFELLYYFGTQLHQNGPAFQQALANSGPVSGMVFQGIGYPNQAHDNQYVPITKLERLEIEVQNPVGMR